MPTNKQRREAARRHLERQLQRRQEHVAVQKRRTLIATIAGTLILAVVIVVVVVAVAHDNKKHPSAASPSDSGSSQPSDTSSPTAASLAETTGPCAYTAADSSGGASIKNTGFPPDPKPTPTKTVNITFATNQGTITMQMDGKAAPCMVQSIAFLVGKKYYDNTSCHRLVTSGIFVLQCGDPTGTGSGGPSYTVKDENLTAAKYTTGMVAMANAGPNTNGSQFFFITKDSTSLPKSYTVIGKVTAGMDVIQKVAAGGSDNANGTGDGKPKITLTFKTVTAAVVGGGAVPGTGPSPTLTTPPPSAVPPSGEGSPAAS